MSAFRLGFVEGFYGRPWSHAERLSTAGFMAQSGYKFYLYAPKGDAFLRRRWREPWPGNTRSELTELVAHFHSCGLSFGVGLSPHEFHLDSSQEANRLLLTKVEEIIGLGVDHVALLFDDMRGDLTGLAAKQAVLANLVRARWPQTSLSLCPTYYSDDPLLDRLFGTRPPDYLKTIGRELDPSIEVFWTGERICSKAYTLEHLRKISTELCRPPLLWDNYPVNDTETMCRFLHLKPFTGRPASLATALSGHLVNPMLQAVLSRVPALTLAESYSLKSTTPYDPERAFKRAVQASLGADLAPLVERDLKLFSEEGLTKLSRQKCEELKGEYRAVDHPAAKEITAWLNGDYAVTVDLIRAQQ